MSEHDERMVRLAGAKTRCPEYYEMTPGDGGSCNKHCKAGCGGTGKVPLLGSEVRVTCPQCEGATIRYAALVPGRFDGRDCLVCHGLGYTPTTNGDAWAQALWPLMDKLCKAWCCPGVAEQYYRYERARITGDLPAALEAAENALIATGQIETVPAEEKQTP